MNKTILNSSQPELRNILTEASHALARLDGERLEEIASYCATLVGDEAVGGRTSIGIESECCEASKEMAIFMRVLEATRANLNVMRRLREIHSARLEYSLGTIENVQSAGSDHVDH